MRYYLGVDEGTTGVTAVIFDEQFTPVGRGYQESTQYYPQPGWVEHDAPEIFENTLSAIGQALQNACLPASALSAIGIDHEGESVVLWNKETGEPVANSIVWQDKRTVGQCEDVEKRYGTEIRNCTGLSPDPYFSASKIAWILEHEPKARALLKEHKLLAGNMDAYFVWRLTGGKAFATDISTASRTLLMNLEQGRWDERMLEIWGIEKEILPEICDSASAFGVTDPDVFFGTSVPITGLICDQQAALYGNRCFTSGSVKTTYGTGCFMLMNVGERPAFSKSGLLPTAAWRLDGKASYALDGGIYIAGAAITWLRDRLKVIQKASETEAMALSLKDNGDVYFVPAFAGLAAPHWDACARGTIVGLTGGTGAEHIVRATLESCAYQVRDVFDAMQKDSGIAIREMRCDGGMVHNKFLMQFQADILNIPLIIPEFADSTALGSAMLAAKGAGTETYPPSAGKEQVFEPHMSEDERQTLLSRWHQALERAKQWTNN